MGVWRDIGTSERRREMAQREAKLAGLLADRAAGKRVLDQDILSYRKTIELDRIYLDSNAKADARDEFEQQQRSAATHGRIAAKEDQWSERRRAERDAAQQAKDRFSERVAAHEDLLREQLEEHAKNLERMLEDDASLSREQLLESLLFAASLLVQEDADQLGPIFGRVRRWVMDGEDPEGFFSTSAAAEQIDPDSYIDDINYREAIVVAVAGDEFLKAAFSTWEPLLKAELALLYPDFNANLSDVEGPGHDGTPKGLHLWHNEKLNTLVFNELDTERWKHRALFSLPLPRELATGIMGQVIEHSASRCWALDADRKYCLLGRQLYALQGGPRNVGKLEFAGLEIFGPGSSPEPKPSTYWVQQHLVVIDERPIWVGAVVEADQGDKTPDAGKATGTKRQSGVVSIDMASNRLMWSAVDSPEHHPGGWQLDNTTRTWWALATEYVPVAPSPTPEKTGLLQRLFKSVQKPVEQKTESVHTVVERDALSGEELRRIPIHGQSGWMHAHLRLESDGRLSLWDLHTRLGFFDRSSLVYVEDKSEEKPLPLGDVGDGPIHVLQQTLRYHGGRRGKDGQLLPSVIRLVKTGGFAL